MTDEKTPIGDLMVTFNGEQMMIKDVPDETIREQLGYGHPGWRSREVHPGYEVHPGECTYGHLQWTWINDGQNLVCPRCGLDGT